MKIYPITKWRVAAMVVTVIALHSSLLRAQTDTGDDTQFLIESTVGDLASPDAATADKAEKTLIGLGDAALPAIQKIEEQTRNVQLRARAERVLAALEAKFKVDPTLVTLKLDNVAPEKVFAELSRIGGVRADGQWDFWSQNNPHMPKHVSVDFQNMPFTQALYEATQKTKVHLQQNWEAAYALQPEWSETNLPLTSLAGSMLFYIESMQRSSQMDFSTKRESDGLSIQLNMIADPKLPLARIFSPAVLTEATGDTGDSLIDPDNNGPAQNGQWSSSCCFTNQTEINLKFKTGADKMIKSLKGYARVATISAPLKFVFDDLVQGKSLKQGDWTVTIEQMSVNGQQVNVQVNAVTSQPADTRNWNGPESCGLCMLYDANGLPYLTQGNGGGSGPGSIQMFNNFMAGPNGASGMLAGKPAKLVVIIGQHLRAVRIPFEFHDLPIPSPGY